MILAQLLHMGLFLYCHSQVSVGHFVWYVHLWYVVSVLIRSFNWNFSFGDVSVFGSEISRISRLSTFFPSLLT